MTVKYENTIIGVLCFFWGGGGWERVLWGEYHNVIVSAQSYDA